VKVGDIVRQGERVIQMKGRKPGGTLGVVIEINKTDFPDSHKHWQKILGKNTITVLWESGKLTENMAENSLEIVIVS
jgi:hypothetical protein